MRDIFAKIADAKIREAIEKGELKNLPGAGKPVIIEDMLFVPEEDRLAYIVLKNSGLTPDEVALKKEMDLLRKSIAECPDGEKKELLKKKLRETSIRYQIIMEKRARRR
ncbi:MAG: DUF1992 domain-containing protein [Heliobacteriaceae bacterium]|nr:DUF1992 domain-containing protein [Heliobacteriaceae bacterium]MDD4587496.1 DUF1992 domain-containing protein [Heliobacteriaceae bacterium]